MVLRSVWPQVMATARTFILLIWWMVQPHLGSGNGGWQGRHHQCHEREPHSDDCPHCKSQWSRRTLRIWRGQGRLPWSLTETSLTDHNILLTLDIILIWCPGLFHRRDGRGVPQADTGLAGGEWLQCTLGRGPYWHKEIKHFPSFCDYFEPS